MQEIKFRIPDMTSIVKAAKRHLQKIASYRNEAIFIMAMIFSIWCVQRGIEFWNGNEIGSVISKWDYAYLLTGFYALVVVAVLVLGVKFMMRFIFPSIDFFAELEFSDIFTKLKEWQKVRVFLFVFFALLYGLIWLSTSLG